MSSGSSASWASIVPRLQDALAPRYEVLELLGHGGMAGVYLANETRLGRQVAIKVISPSLVMDESFVARFEQEARATARMRHTNIVTIYEVDHKDDFLFIAMSYCSGRTLGAVMKEESEPMGPDVALAWLYEVASALDHAHHHGIIHRDIKPGNILLDDEGRALVADFGIAKVADQPGLTSTGFLVGTPAYMSPEQCGGSEITTASDQYSLGVVAYEMLTGTKPFEGATMRVIHAHLSEVPRPIIELRPNCPPDLAEAVTRMLAKEPESRWPSSTAAIRAAGGGPITRGDSVYKTMTSLSRQVSTIQVSAASLELQPSEEFSLEAIPLDASLTPIPGRPLSWTSSDPEVAQVAEDGTVIAKKPGKAVLAIRGGSAVQAVEVEVTDSTGTFSTPAAPATTPSAHTPLPRPAAEANENETIVADTGLIRELTGQPSEPQPPVQVPESTGSSFTELFSGPPSELEADPPPAAVASPKPPPKTRPVAPKPSKATATPAKSTGPNRMMLTLGGVGVAAVVGAVALLSLRGGDSPTPPVTDPTQSTPTEVASATPSTDPIPIGTADSTSTADSLATDRPVESGPTEAAPPAEATPTDRIPPVQPAAPTTGTIRLQGTRPGGAVITAVGPDGRTRNVSGVTDLPPGQYRLTGMANGFETVQTTLSVRVGATASWRPAWVAVAAPTPDEPPAEEPPTSPSSPAALSDADVQVMRAQVSSFLSAFAARDVGRVMPLLPSDSRDGFTQVLTLNYSRFELDVGSLGTPSLDGDTATLQVPTTLRSTTQGYSSDSPLNFLATWVRSGSDWTLRTMAPGAE